MVFFTLTLRLSDELPDILIHNVPGSLHIGDFVLPMFLFASGMSIVFFARKRKKNKRTDYILDVIERFGKLILVSFFLTPFSSGGFLEMDEVMLSAVLFVPAVLLVAFPEIAIAAVGIAIFILYLILQQSFMLPDFTTHYLGGYSAAIFYLPVMLAGVIAGKRINGIRYLVAASVILAIIVMALTPPFKMSVSPSFMALSVVFSLVVFAIVRDVKIKELDYLGRTPFRYWVLMFLVILIPLAFYSYFIGSEGSSIGLGWIEAVVISLLCSVLLYMVSKGLDAIGIFLRIIPHN
jgi:hypothetical protein